MTSSSVLISIIGVSISLLINAVSLPLLCLLLAKRRNSLCSLFLVNICSWIIGITLCSVYFLYITVNWRGDYSLYSMTLMFWFGTPFFGVMASLSTSVFFLTWDRCLTLIIPYTYNKDRRKYFVIACICAQVAAFLWMGFWLQTDRPPLGRMSDCMSYGCVGSTVSQKVTNMKIFFAATNIISAFVFALLFLKFSKKESSSGRTKKTNLLAFLTLFTEILFNCLPNCGAEIFTRTYGVVLSPIIGPYVSYMFSVECFIMSLIYTYTIGMPCARNNPLQITYSSQVTPLRPSNSNQPPSKWANKVPIAVS